MSYQENRTIAYLISSLIGAGIYTFNAIQKYQEGSIDPTTISSDWGSLILKVIAVQVVLSIVASILVTIIEAIRTRDEDPDIEEDERDKLVELESNQLAYSVFGVGFLAAMITLAVGWPPLVMFNILIFSLFAAGIVGFIRQLYLYRRGF